MIEAQQLPKNDTFTFWRQRITPLIDAENQKRSQSLKAALHGLPDVEMVVNTSKVEKIEAVLGLVRRQIGVQLLLGRGAFLLGEMTEPEMMSHEASAVAESKARQVLTYRRPVQGTELIAVGLDVNAFFGTEGIESQSHKLSRLGPEFVRVNREAMRKKIIKQYTKPVDGIVRNRWDVAMHVINGTDHAFGDEIELRAKPVDRELLIQALDQAEENGLFLSSNLHFATIECLREQGEIISVAFLPQALKQQGITFAQVRQVPTPELLDIAQHSIVTNIPASYQ
jgi:hypothetical protein